MNRRNAHGVQFHGSGPGVIVIGHGIGATPEHWNPVVEVLAVQATVVTYHLAGSPGADPALFSPLRHDSVMGYADDLTLLVTELGLRGCAYLGHSMSAAAGALAQAADPELFSRMVLLNGSARYVNDQGYVGGFTAGDVENLLAAVMVDYDLWAAGFGSYVVGNPEHPEAASEFVSSLRALGPEVAGVMLRAALLGDFREYMPYVSCPTLVLQSRDDPAVPIDAARWLADAIPDAQFGSLRATGHHPHLVDPGEVADRVAEFLLSPS